MEKFWELTIKRKIIFQKKVALIFLRHRIRFQEGHWKPNVLLQ